MTKQKLFLVAESISKIAMRPASLRRAIGKNRGCKDELTK